MRNANLSFPTLSAAAEIPLEQAFGALCFSGAALPQSMAEQTPCLRIPMPVLAGDAACELWLGDGIAPLERQENLIYRRSASWVFGVIELNEEDTAPVPLQRATENAYRQMFALLDRLDFPFVYRCWNYMADINAVSHGLERYRQFNLGRQDAFLACGRDVEGELPAACALGVAHGPLQIAFLAGRTPAQAIENPRQVNAYDYPQDYGPRSPTFSRASLLRLPDGEALFISGTASIVGHRTRHAGDALGQMRETLANIEAVLVEANQQLDGRRFDPAQLFYRVYVRHAADLPAIRNELTRLTGQPADAIFLQADICRDDLLLEIEATAFSRTNQNTDGQ